ncbi:MAG: hypothetical protein K940chlam5_01025 [Candidatus Anoxychlamydiales bacterium]|nr:hypothetical protein [Candidatus Anoxychlamydiales bacterium]
MKKDVDLLIQELKGLVSMLNNSLPKEIPLGISISIDPTRAVIFRVAFLYRVAEITESAYDAFVKDNLVVAFILSRAFMETETLFWAFVNKLKVAIQTRNINDIRQFLTGCLIGVKNDELKQLKHPSDVSLITTPTNILTFIQKMDKKIPGYELHHASLSEFSHPNAAGTVDAYVSLDWEAMVARFGKNKSKLIPELALPQLLASLKGFLDCYDYSAKLLEQFVPLCEELLPKSTQT